MMMMMSSHSKQITLLITKFEFHQKNYRCVITGITTQSKWHHILPYAIYATVLYWYTSESLIYNLVANLQRLCTVQFLCRCRSGAAWKDSRILAQVQCTSTVKHHSYNSTHSHPTTENIQNITTTVSNCKSKKANTVYNEENNEEMTWDFLTST